jgi:negative regulator of sigma E activity
MYTDGLAAFSVFVEAMPEPGAASVESRNGATVAVTQPLGLETLTSTAGSDAGGAGETALRHLVTVVGEIPVVTARRIAGSIQPRDGS